MVSSNEGMQDAHANPEEDPDVPPAKRTFSFLNTYTLPRRATPEFTMMETLVLGYQSLGVVYGDIGTSPLYVFSSLKLENPGEQEILGIFSLIFWTLTLMGLIKYVSIVLHADDHGEGGTFALYSLLRQHINFKGNAIMPATRLDSDVKLQFHSKSSMQSKAHKFLEESSRAQVIITYIVLIGTCMVIGDGALTPAISVLSAVQGIQSRSPNITQEHVVLLSVAILLFLFLFQRFGTSKVSFSFSPIMLLWFTFGTGIGVYNIIKFYPPVLKALSPYYIYKLFEGKGRRAWGLLGAIVLSVTGAEAMFADLGHFNKQGIQIAFSAFVYPALILTYGGEAAFLIKNPGQLSTTFYSSVPEPIFWPMFVIATLAAIVASQALISASFSIIRQSIALGFFPRVTMRHTSIKHEGQVYSPEVNYFLMIVCIIVTCGFKGGVEIGNAFGVAVIWVMLITTFLMAIVMLVIWDTNVILVGFFLVVFVGIEGTYMTALLEKIPQGGWVPFAVSAFVLVITLSWSHGRSMKSEYERKNKIDRVELNELLANNTIPRVDGICFFCTDLTNGIPPIVRHYVQHAGALRKVMIMVTVRILPVKSVLPEERYIVAKLGPTGVYRCLVQYGYMDNLSMEGDEYIYSVIRTLKEEANDYEEIQLLESALDTGAVFVLGRIILKPGEKNGWFKNLIIGTIYRFLQKNFRSSVGALQIPPGKMLQVGMLYEI